tara:strand:+ start:13593 stop:15761 length:2169 start_codon:yes stop_codon:yes gene_type:complete
MVHKKAQFDDRIRNLLALAEDNSVESRTLLFSHICDLFLQDRPMESDNQVRMLIEIINELIGDVDLAIRKELANILLTIDSPPEELIKLISEDVVEVSAKILEEAMIDEEQLLYLIKYASDDHREHISRRFGLSPLLRRELDKARKESDRIKSEVTELLTQAESKKISLQELEEAEQNSTVLNEDATANILEVLRSQKNKKSDISIVPETPDDIEAVEATIIDEPTEPGPVSLTSKITQIEEVGKDLEELLKKSVEDDELEDNRTNEPVADEASLEDELILDHEAPQSGPTSVSDEWFWEIDRYGNIRYLSENAESVFLQTPPSLVGEDFLCLWRRDGADENDTNEFIALFEKRQPFRNEPFQFEISPNVFQGYLLSAIATFDLDNGRFTGFRGSAHLDETEIEIPRPQETNDNDQATEAIFEAEEEADLILTSPLADDDEIDENHRPEFSDSLINESDEDHKGEISKEGDLPASKPTAIEQDEVASELLHNLSHEFRTPLNAIIGFSQMIDNEMWGPVSDQYRKSTKDIINAANHLKEAVNNILDSAKMEAGLIEPSPESFSLKSIIQDAINAVSPIFESREINVSGVDDNIDVILYNDKHCIILCLIKIITFATKHADIGDDFHLSALVNSNAQVRIEIPILNQNISEDDAPQLFQKTHKLGLVDDGPRSETAEYETKISSGFGLSVAQDIAKLIGGELSTMSKNGKVTHVIMTISTYPI